jgi:hypothetical protein
MELRNFPELYQDFEINGRLRESVIMPALFITKYKNSSNYNVLAKAYDVVSTWYRACSYFDDLQCQHLPFEQKIKLNNYEVEEMDFEGRLTVLIRRPLIDNLYISLQVKNNGNFWRDRENVECLGFRLIGTNGNAGDCQEAANIITEIMLADNEDTIIDEDIINYD